MSARLAIEQQLRDLEHDEERRAAKIRAELSAAPSLRLRRVHIRHRTRHLLVLDKDGRSLCARYLLEWWERRSRHGGAVKRPVSTNEINRLAAILRRLE